MSVLVDHQAELLMILAIAHRQLDLRGYPPAPPRPIDGRPVAEANR